MPISCVILMMEMSEENKRNINNKERLIDSVSAPNRQPERSRSAFAGVLWSFAERGSTQLATFVITIILARLLTPTDFGLIGMLLIFVEIGEALATAGLTETLIKRGFRNPGDAVAATLFNAVAGIIIYLIIYFTSPAIAEMYSIPQLVPLARALAILIPVRAVTSVGIARLTRNMDFRSQAVASLTAILISGVVAVVSASSGLGVWALVVFQVGRAVILFIGINIITLPLRKREGKGRIELPVIKSMLRFGSGLTGARLVDIAYNNSYLMAIGLMMPPADVGFFTRGRQFACVPSISFGEVIRRVAYPVLCKLNESSVGNDDELGSDDKRRELLMRLVSLVMFVAVPVMLTLAALSESIIGVLLGDKWLVAAPIMSIICLGTLWVPFDSLNLTVLPATGRSGALFRIELLRKAIGLIFLAVTLNFGLLWICGGYAVSALVSAIATAEFCGRRLQAGALRQFRGISRIILLGLFASSVAWICGNITSSYPVRLIVGVGTSFAVYLLLAVSLRLPELPALSRYLRHLSKKENAVSDSIADADMEAGPIRILHVYPELNCGGLERVIRDIITHTDKGLFVHDILVQSSGAADSFFESGGVKIIQIPFDGDVKGYRAALRDLFTERRYDVVHCHNHREMSMVNQEARRCGIRLRIAHSHNAHQDIPGLKRWLRILRFYRHRKGASVLAGCSRDALDWMFPASGVHGTIIENGVDTERFKFSLRYRNETRDEIGKALGADLTDQDKIVLHVGRLSEQKNQHFILDLAKASLRKDRACGRLIYVLVGDGPLREELYIRKNEEGLDNVVFAGERDDISRWFSGADIFLFPSRYEGQGIAALEAQASGLSVVGSDMLPVETDAGMGLLRRVRGWRISEWLKAIDEQMECSVGRRRDFDERFRYPLSSIIPRYERLYGRARKNVNVIFCREVPSEVITGGNAYDLMMRNALEEIYPGEVEEFYVHPDRRGGALRKIIAPFRALRNGLRLCFQIKNRCKTKVTQERIWVFNTSKCFYFLPLLFALRLKGEKAIGVTHHPLWMEIGGVKRLIYKYIEEMMISLLNVRVAPSRFMKDVLSGNGLSRRKGSRVELLEIPFEFKSSCFRSPESSAARPYLIFVATIEPRKGLHYLIEAIAILKKRGLNIDLEVLGKVIDEQYFERCRKMAADNKIHIEWRGYMVGDDKMCRIAGASALVLPSEAEGYGMVLVEAMWEGTPVVAFRNTGMVDVIGPENARGRLAADRDPESLAEEILRILTDDGERERVVRAGREYASSRPTISDFKKRLREICGSIS